MQKKITALFIVLFCFSSAYAAKPYCRFSFHNKIDLYLKISDTNSAVLSDSLDKKICNFQINSVNKSESRGITFFDIKLISLDCEFKKTKIKSIELKTFPSRTEITYTNETLQKCDDTKEIFNFFNLVRKQ